MALGDLQLFLLRVAGHLDDLHAVPQGPGNGVHAVGGGDEHDLTQVKGHIQIMIPEGGVLLAVQHLQHGAGGIAPEIAAHFVDFIKQEHRVHGARLLDARDDAARYGADVGAPMAPDLRLVPDAAQGHLHKFAAHRPGDALDDGGFAHAGRAHKAQDGPAQGGVPAALLLHAAHSQVLDHPLLHLLHAIVVLIQDAAGALQIQIIGGVLAPGQIADPLQIGLTDGDLRGAGGHAGKALQLPVRLSRTSAGRGNLCSLSRRSSLSAVRLSPSSS